ncbi:MAG: flagellar hook-length control protein FliK [Ruminiclostridium sp.]
MVVNAASTVDFSGMGVQTAEVSDTGVFSKVLRQEINTDTNSVQESDAQTPQTAPTENPESDVVKEITDFIKEKLDEIKSGLTDEDSIEEILLKLLELLKNSKDENESVMALLITAAEQLLNQPKAEETVPMTDENPDETAVDVTEAVQTMRSVQSDSVKPTDELAMLFGEETPQVKEEIRLTEELPQIPVTMEEKAEEILPVLSELPQTETADHTDLIPQETPIPTHAEKAANTAEELFNKLMEFAKNELGLESAGFEEKTVHTEIFTSFVRPETEKSTEIDSLIAHITGKQETREETETPIAPQSLPQTEIQGAQGETTQPEVRQASPTMQVAKAIAAQLETAESGESTFTMTLNPESLGRIAVKLVTNAGKVTVEITAENRITQEILAQRGQSLAANLKENGVDLEKYQVVYEPQQNSLYRENYNGSSKNPYVRQEQENEGDEPEISFADLLMSM